ncbi:hypothetical protein M9458_021079 [Cirrhinus mrigala]|uniref:Kringle domain-containing protein n=1 Tax=Cirrhinus mrigala TaxID=683832 RepID=A0ABD0QHL4_CIRMR
MSLLCNTMFTLGLLTCIVLTAIRAQAKVVTSFKECKEFFYKNTEPGGMDQNAKKICQMIPLYSAYTLDPACSSTPGVKCNWHKDSDENVIKGNQAISSDYSDTGYDRGHLNPNSFQCGTGRTATCTLTNAAPMDACFNRIHWYRWESTLRTLLLPKLVSDGAFATAYIVTGTVPNANKRIPHRETSEDPERVTVPSHIWTAVCYKHHTDDTKSFSFSYMGRNQPAEPGIRVQMSPDVQNTLGAVKRATSSDSISSKSNIKVRKVTAELAFDSLHDYYTVTEELKAFSGSACLLTHAKPLVIHDELRKREVSEGSDAVECLLVPEKQKTAADGSLCSGVSDSGGSCQCETAGETKPCCDFPCLYNDNLSGYRCYSGQEQIPCSPPYSLITYKRDRCLDDYPCATYGYDYYWCWTGSLPHQWDYCSPPLWRSKAENGRYCRSNHACAKYGSRYKWCYTDDRDSWDYCCPSDDCHSAKNGKTCRSDHPCGFHGYIYLWCYTTDGSWDYCCTSNDCLSAVNYKTCRSDHPCGYHGYNYLWCYTDDIGNWDYCCKGCSH